MVDVIIELGGDTHAMVNSFGLRKEKGIAKGKQGKNKRKIEAIRPNKQMSSG